MIAQGNQCKELSNLQKKTIDTMGRIILIKDQQIQSFERQLKSNTQQMQLLTAQTSAYKSTINNQQLQFQDIQRQRDTETKRKRNWRTFGIGSLAVNIGLAAILYLSLK